ncbi:MAG: hypothetical protein JO117_03755 [Verrucomicrobia bacterium]|nr:hypothetical protein [Verrucomicrobiota bacterium]MBV9656668.1 hypothetical protein [Verrucomicrobiota bacterium]
MSFEEFEDKARLFVLGVLEDEDEIAHFEAARREYGGRAEEKIAELQRLSAAFALSLRPTPPQPATKERLLSLIQNALGSKNKNNAA